MAQGAEIGALRVVLAMDAGEFYRGSKQVVGELGSMGRAIAAVSEKINRASVYFNTSIMAAQRFANVVSSILTVTSEFSSGMSSVATLVDTTTENMGKMSEAVLAIGRRTPVALTDLTTGLYDLRSAGTSAEDAMIRLERSAQLGVAGLGSTKEAVDLVTSSINAFGLKGEEADQVYNSIFKTIQAGKTTISGLAQGFGAVAGTVATAGIKLDEYLASIAALTVTGVPAAVAHTQIRAAIAGLTRESELGTKVLDAMGAKTFKDLVERSGGMVNAFKNITAALGGNDANMIKLLGSVEAYNAVIALTGKQNAAFNSTMVNMRNGIDAVGEAFDKKNAGMSAALQRMTNATQELGIALGNALAPTIKAVADVVTSVTEAFKSLSPEMQESLARFGVIAAVIGPATIAVGFFANALLALVPVFTSIAAVIAGFVAASGPIGAFVIAASAAVTAWNIFKDDIINIFESVFAFISEKVSAIIERLTALKNFISGVWSSFTEGGVSAAVETVTKAMTDGFGQVELQMGGVVAMYDTLKIKQEEAAKNAFVYSGPVIAATDAEAESVRNRNSAYREGLQLFNETLTPMEELIFKQMQINGLFQQGAIDATTYGRAMAQASAFSAKNMDALASTVSSNLSTIFGETKGVAIATAIINTAQGVTQALAQYPPPISFAMAAIQAAAGAAQIAAIRNTSKTGGGGGAAAASSDAAAAGTGGGAGSAPQSLMIRGISASQLYGGGDVRELVQRITTFQKDGGEVFIQ